jgi:hypothetical protein
MGGNSTSLKRKVSGRNSPQLRERARDARQVQRPARGGEGGSVESQGKRKR